MTPEEVSNQVKELESLRGQLRLWRIVIPLATVAIVCYGVFSIYSAGKDLVADGPPREEFVASLTDGLKREVQPVVERIAQQTFSDTKRSVEKEITRLNDRTPEMAGAIKKEVETLMHNIPRNGEKVLQASFGAMLKKREADIRKMYPDVTEQKVASLVMGLTDVTHQRLDHVTQQLFSPHLESLSLIMDDVAHIQRTEAVNPKEDLASWDMALVVFDLIRDEFADLQAVESAAVDTAAPVKLPKKVKPAAKPAKP
ncbi:MAG: hypothetical protein ABMA26_21720 [Limisphaerales bacterium]